MKRALFFWLSFLLAGNALFAQTQLVSYGSGCGSCFIFIPIREPCLEIGDDAYVPDLVSPAAIKQFYKIGTKSYKIDTISNLYCPILCS